MANSPGIGALMELETKASDDHGRPETKICYDYRTMKLEITFSNPSENDRAWLPFISAYTSIRSADSHMNYACHVPNQKREMFLHRYKFLECAVEQKRSVLRKPCQ